MLEIGTRVKLIKFNGTINTPKDCDKQENYWSLIGEFGKIVKPKNNRLRVLIQFENLEKLKKLHCHPFTPVHEYPLLQDITLHPCAEWH